MLYPVTTPSPHRDAMLLFQNTNEAYTIPLLTWTQSHMEERRRERGQRKRGNEVEAGGVWFITEALCHLISHCHILLATLSIPHYHLSSLIPLHVHSLTPLFSVSHAARHKRQRGGSEGWIKDSSLFLPWYKEKWKDTETERGSRRGFLSSSSICFILISF